MTSMAYFLFAVCALNLREYAVPSIRVYHFEVCRVVATRVNIDRVRSQCRI